jgi:predicted methyltransferase
MIRNNLAVVAAFLFTILSAANHPAPAADRFDAAIVHPGRPAADPARDAKDHPAEILRLTGINSGMQVADVLAGDGYYSELLSYIVGVKGQVLLINNAAFDQWSEPDLQNRVKDNRLPNVRHQTVDLNDMKLPPASLDAVLLVKVYHDLYWVNSNPKNPWPKVDAGAVLEQLSRALKPRGILLLVDHSAKAGHGSSDAGELHRIDEAYAIKDFKAHGFDVIAKSDLLKMPDDARDQISYKGPMLGKTDRFVLVFRKT